MVPSISIDDTRTRHPHFAGMPWNLLPSTKASGRSTPAATPRPNGWAAFWEDSCGRAEGHGLIRTCPCPESRSGGPEYETVGSATLGGRS